MIPRNVSTAGGLQRWIAQEKAAGGAPAPETGMSGATWLGHLRRLRALVAGNDAIALETCEEMLPRVPSAAGEKFAEVRAALQACELDAALAAIDALMQTPA